MTTTPSPESHADGLRAAMEALADEWDRLAGGNEAARGRATKVAGYYRRHAALLRAALAAHPTPAGSDTAGERLAEVEAELRELRRLNAPEHHTALSAAIAIVRRGRGRT